MKKLKIITVVGFAAAIVLLFILRAPYVGKKTITAEEFAVSGIQNGIAIECGDVLEDVYITVPDGVSFEEVISVSTAPDVAYILIDYDDAENDRVLCAEVVGLSPGIAKIYVRSADGSKVSEKYTVNIISSGSTVSNTESPAASPESVQLPDNAVYVTPSGTKYHLRSKCAGDTAKAVSLEEAVENGYLPCKICAMNK